MNIHISHSPEELGTAAGKAAAERIREAIEKKGEANIILATGTSQFETIRQLISEDIDWSAVTMFHLDEYIGLPVSHAASFRRYLRERFLNKVKPLKNAYLINGETDAESETARLDELIRRHPIDVALVGIGENGHLAFNDPPANFETDKPYLTVTLDEPCRMQQFNEGWFESINAVPRQAISMSVRQIMKSAHIICSVPDKRKARAVKDSLENSVDNRYPASILQMHNSCLFFLDTASASLLNETVEQ